MRSVAARVTSKWLAVLDAQLLGDQPGFQPRNAVDGQHGTVPGPAGVPGAAVEREQEGVQFGQPGAQVHSAALQQPGGEAEPDGGIVVAAGEDHLGAGAGQPDQGVVEQADDVDAGQGTVVDVTGDQDDVHRLVRGRRRRAGR